tara:strand:+ start:7169 stop:7969 length:801 start_codon:yes stop_codon:yes gene_type:complete
MNKSIYEKINTDIQLGANIEISRGRIEVYSDDKPVDNKWYADNEKRIISHIASKLSINAFEYESYSTGMYGTSKWSGITLQFIELSTLEPAYSVFNADLSRKRSSNKNKKGEIKASGQFTVKKRYSFFKFWSEAGLGIPNDRLSKICERMSWLKPIIFTGKTLAKEKLDKATFKPLMVSSSEVHSLFITDNTRTRYGQDTDKTRTRSTDKETQYSYEPRDLQGIQTTGDSNYGKRLKGSAVIHSPIPLTNTPSNQSTDEWLSDYES